MKYVARLQEFSLKRLALLTLLLGSPWLFPQEAESQTKIVNFSGIVDPSCTVGEPTSGTMVLTSPSILSTTGEGGTSATITISCNTNTNIRVDSISQQSGPEVSSATVTVTDPAALDFSATNANIPQTSPSPYPIPAAPFTDQQYLVDLELTNEPSIQSGTYSYTVGVTFLPFN